MSILREAIAALEKAGIDTAKLDAELLFAHVLGCSRLELKTKKPELSPEQQQQFDGLLARRIRREPIAYILGHKEFWSMNFKVTPAVLCPRPDTEILIETALPLIRPSAHPHILDLGTGSGAILLSLLSELPHATGLGVDISLEAIEIARENAHNLGLASRSNFLLGSWCDGLSDLFDLIVSNPPYIESATIEELAPEVAVFEPKLALDGGDDGLLAYRTLIPQLPSCLRPGGWVMVEVGAGQAKAVEQLMSEQLFENISSFKDYQGIERCVKAQRHV